MNIKDKIKKQYKKKRLSKITRRVSKKSHEISSGYIVDYSKDFVILQETDNFQILGFNILPIKDFSKVRYNKYDKYYDKIMTLENEKEKIGLKTKINLSDWSSIFKTLKKNGINVIAECENPKIGSFTIGEITKVTNKSVSIRYFDATGFLNENPTKLRFKNITKVTFNDRYIDIFSKYLRERKRKKKQ